MAVTIIPNVTNWTVTPQNGQAGYFTLMNTWLGQSTTVIASLQAAVTAQNTANSEINALAIQVANDTVTTVAAKDDAVSALAILANGSINDTTIDTNKAYSNQKTNELLALKVDKAINSLTAKATPADADNFVISDSGATHVLKKLTWSNIKTALNSSFVGLTGNQTKDGILTFSSQPVSSSTQGTNTDDLVKYGTINLANSAPIKTALNASGTAPIYACRAWVNFNGTGTVAIRASGNVSSITDNGTGDYTVNFTTGMSDINYSVAYSCKEGSAGSSDSFVTIKEISSNPTVNSLRIQTNAGGIASASDCEIVSVSIFR
jgi:hypothetical protein